MFFNIGLCTNLNQSNSDCKVGYWIIKYYTVSFIAAGFENESYARVYNTS